MSTVKRLTATSRLIHLGIAAFGIAAYLSAEGAESARASPGYLLHAYLGFAVAATIGLRVAWGIFGPATMRFSSWSPFSARQWTMAREDLRGLVRLRLPDRPLHQGIAGLVQMFGLVLLGYMAVTGTALYFATGVQWVEMIEEAHELGEALIPAFLFVHVAAVIAHSIVGLPVWQNAFGFWQAREIRNR